MMKSMTNIRIANGIKALSRKELEECFVKSLHREHEAIHRANKLEQQNQQLHNKIDKAIEYIKELYDNTDDITCYDIDRNTRDDLLEILKDSDVDE